VRRTSLISLAVLGLIAIASAQDIYVKPGIPDVDKPNRPGDNSCWIAVASNLLGAAGYGQGATAQERGTYIYNKMVGDLGYTSAGRAEWAINYYLYKYAKNPNAGIDFQHSISYTDVTYKRLSDGYLKKSDYDFLLDELKRCQYVGFSIAGVTVGHALTLVGGLPSTPNGNPLVVHDSDQDAAGKDDNYYNNFYDADDDWYVADYFSSKAGVYAYQTLCPGLNKPLGSVLNYDVAWYRNMWSSTSSVLMPSFQETGKMASIYDDPYWDTSKSVVTLGNQRSDTLTKMVYLLVDLADRSGYQDPDVIKLLDDRGKYWDPASIEVSLDGGQLLYKWTLNYQPGWEQIIFPNTDYYYLDGRIKDWNVTTECVPGPAAALSFAVAFTALLRRRKER